ncbi:MAG: NTP transferase domain-containing protein [Caldilineaceae bacterium]|nr:NTP transferase domain-containing protein [Caldilineaceae bacterium]HRJ45675.1 hypothetical protein [Caldilineaceae bacterium]
MNVISTAVLLLAGNDPRYADETEHIPYGLLEVDGRTLLQCAIDQLRQGGMKRIIIVTGQRSRSLAALSQTPGVEVIYDALFADFGSMFALRRIAPFIHSFPFLLVESTLLFESRVARLAHGMTSPNGIVVAETNKAVTGILAEATNSRLLALTRSQIPAQARSAGSYLSLGILKISRHLFAEMLAFAVQRTYTDPFLDYVECVNGVAPAVDIRLAVASTHLWSRINSRPDVDWALNHLYPRILQQQQHPSL